jgi:hypothetical protein
MNRRLLTLLAVVALSVGPNHTSVANTSGETSHLTVYDAGVAEFLETRTIELQSGRNTIEWRSLMPKARIRTIRVTAENAEVVRQDVSYDGTDVRNEKSPVLHLSIRNPGAAGSRRVQVDYMAPGMGWHNDYSLVLDPAAEGVPPTSALLDSWVSVRNQTGADVTTGTIDLVAGEISLLSGEDARDRSDQYAAQTLNVLQRSEESGPDAESASADGDRISAFHRFRLGRDLTMNANAPINRFPLFQKTRIDITHRNVFENEHGTQTLARGGFVLLPRGLEVRLVSKNPTEAPMPAGQVTIYARTGELLQIVGQDRVPLTPSNADFGVSQGRSATLFGTRRVLERRQVSYKREDGNSRDKLVTRIEVVLTNRSAVPVEARVREGIEAYGENQWTLSARSAPSEQLGANTVQFRVEVPARGKTTVSYTVEVK